MNQLNSLMVLLRLLTHVMISAKFSCGYYFLNFLCFHIQKYLILHALAVSKPININ